ncbi:hypothetical protein ANCCAN_01117 [Ancylostoma caninum]|uniref:G-protein coupled receptors family 1 profile domain-containing protein n=1 Tax=Ancylostoma caninum TaxID=29170 RepID=A0A368H811_ANCCA|nr:hypothetical protein ANCCAN_01117 [Ancylostoma caninum]
MNLYEIDVEHPRTPFDVSDYYTVVLCIVYLLIGTTSILFNIFNIYVFGRKKSLRKKYIVFIFLEAAEVVNGVAYIMTGAGRLSSIANGRLHNEISVEGCFFTKPWPVLVLVGTQLPALVVIFASIERTIAVHRPSQYYRQWNYSYKLKRLFLLIVVQMVGVDQRCGSVVVRSAGDEPVRALHDHLVHAHCLLHRAFPVRGARLRDQLRHADVNLPMQKGWWCTAIR